MKTLFPDDWRLLRGRIHGGGGQLHDRVRNGIIIRRILEHWNGSRYFCPRLTNIAMAALDC
jgi:hypothetical protein